MVALSRSRPTTARTPPQTLSRGAPFNVAPTADISNDGPIDEGGSATVSLTNPFDPSSEDTTAGFHYAFSCTNDALPDHLRGRRHERTRSTCPFADDGSYKVSGRIFDKDDGYTDYDTTVVVRNVAPTITSATVTGGIGRRLPARQRGRPGLRVDRPGRLERHLQLRRRLGRRLGARRTASGQVSPVTGLSHTYGPGTFTISIVVSDEDGGASDAVTRQVSHRVRDERAAPADQRRRANDFKLGSTIPVKVRASDCTGAPVDGVDLHVHLAMGGSPVAQAAASNGDTGMRYTDGQYLFNLSTKRSQFAGGQDLTAGTYHLWVTGPIGATDAVFDLR